MERCGARARLPTPRHGIKSGSINPNLFQSQEYRFGSIANPSSEVRKLALGHLLESVEVGRALGSRDISLWVSDGSNYPGTQSMRKRIGGMEKLTWVREIFWEKMLAVRGNRSTSE